MGFSDADRAAAKNEAVDPESLALTRFHAALLANWDSAPTQAIDVDFAFTTDDMDGGIKLNSIANILRVYQKTDTENNKHYNADYPAMNHCRIDIHKRHSFSEWRKAKPELTLLYHNLFGCPQIFAVVDAKYRNAMHAVIKERFPVKYNECNGCMLHMQHLITIPLLRAANIPYVLVCVFFINIFTTLFFFYFLLLK